MKAHASLALAAVAVFVLAAAPRAGQNPGSAAPAVTVEKAVWFIERDRFADALDIIEAIVAQDAARVEPTLAALNRFWSRFRFDQRRDYTDRLVRLVATCRRQLATLPREDAARGAYLLNALEDLTQPDDFNNTNWKGRTARFIVDYAGTNAALEAEVDRICDRVSAQCLADLEAFAAAHPATTAAAKARHQVAFQWGNNSFFLEPRDIDPTDRLLRVMDIVRDLESGRFPPCKWVKDAHMLVVEFFNSDREKFAPANVDRVLEAYRSFVLTHFPPSATPPVSQHIDYVIGYKMLAVPADKAAGAAAVLRLLDELERDPARAARAKYLRADFFLRQSWSANGDSEAARRTARDLFATLRDGDDQLFAIAAAEELGALAFRARDDAAALENYAKAETLRRGEEAAWMDAMRVAQAQEALGQTDAAIAGYRSTAARYSAVAQARVLGRVFAARLLESVGRLADANGEYGRALREWGDEGDYFNFNGDRPTAWNESLRVTSAPASKAVIAQRVRELDAALVVDGGELFEQARAALRGDRPEQAIPLFEEFLGQHPRAALASEARTGIRRGQLDLALRLADRDNPLRDEQTATARLTALAGQSYDFPVFASQVALATLRLGRDQAGAEQDLEAALGRWETFSGARATDRPAAGSLEDDVQQIRALLFRPRGGGVYTGNGWNAFEFPRKAPRFVITSAETTVRFADRSTKQISGVQTFPNVEHVLFLDGDQIGVLTGMISQLGGRATRAPAQIMETPNQPVGASLDIMGLWMKFFETRPGHWGGWEVGTYPGVGSIEFLDAERTTASVAVGLGYSGATALLEKHDGVWFAIKLVNFWVT